MIKLILFIAAFICGSTVFAERMPTNIELLGAVLTHPALNDSFKDIDGKQGTDPKLSYHDIFTDLFTYVDLQIKITYSPYASLADRCAKIQYTDIPLATSIQIADQYIDITFTNQACDGRVERIKKKFNKGKSQ